MAADIIRSASRLVEPTQKEIRQVDSVAERSIELVRQKSKEFNDVVNVVFGGSYAKGTWLRGDVDVDIFAMVDPKVSEERFEKIGKELGFQALKRYGPYLRYSQHPYVEALVEGIRVNVVPCYRVEEGRWISAADRSPYHTRFIADSFDKYKRAQARLLKKFMKGVGVYGAEISKSGFSGYVCEVLILKYGSFPDVLKAAAKFSENEVISIGEAGMDKDLVSTFRSPLVILDPVDPRRNLGTAISHESVGRLILASRRFVKKPELKYFTGPAARKIGFRDLQRRRLADNMIVIRFRHAKRSQDIIWGQLKSSANAVAKQLTLQGFRVIRSGCSTDEDENGVFVFLLESAGLPRLAVKQGPKVFGESNSGKFLQKNRESLLWVGNDARIMALVNNKFTDAKTFLGLLLGQKISSSGISRGLTADIRKRGARIYAGRDLAKIKDVWIWEVIGDLVTTDGSAFGSSR